MPTVYVEDDLVSKLSSRHTDTRAESIALAVPLKDTR